MTDQEMLKLIFGNLNEAAKKHRAKAISSASRDCMQACSDACDKCLASAGSDLEKAVCNSAYMKCVANC